VSIDDNQSVDASAEAAGEWAIAAPTPKPTANMPSRAKPRVPTIGLLPAFGRRVSADGVSMRWQTGSAHREFSLFSAVSRGPYRNIRHTSTVCRGLP
jgi:hypothetical protein